MLYGYWEEVMEERGQEWMDGYWDGEMDGRYQEFMEGLWDEEDGECDPDEPCSVFNERKYNPDGTIIPWYENDAHCVKCPLGFFVAGHIDFGRCDYIEESGMCFDGCVFRPTPERMGLRIEFGSHHRGFRLPVFHGHHFHIRAYRKRTFFEISHYDFRGKFCWALALKLFGKPSIVTMKDFQEHYREYLSH